MSLSPADDLTRHSLAEEDRSEIISLLARAPLPNLTLLERVERRGVGGSGCLIGIRKGRSLVAVATATPSVHLGCDQTLDPSEIREAGAMLAAGLRTYAIPIRAIVAQAALVHEVWSSLSPTQPTPTVDRRSQPLYSVDPADVPPPSSANVRLAVATDLDELVTAGAAMYREELMIDPLKRDPSWFRERTAQLIARKRAWIWSEDEVLLFKAEIAAEWSGYVQLMGVWTKPERRRQGVALEGLSQVLRRLSRSSTRVSLFVNDFNTPARTLYERLGFVQSDEMRALIW